MKQRALLVSVSAITLALMTVTPSSVHAQSSPAGGRSPFDWSTSYLAVSLAGGAFGEMAPTSVDDKFGVLGTKPQNGLVSSAEYGRLIDPQYDLRLALRSAAIPEHIVDAAGGGGVSYGKTKLGYQTFDVEIGRRLQLSDPVALRFFAGVRAIHAHDRAEEIALGFFSSGQTVKADTVGAGPRAGMEFSARLGEQPVFLTGGIDGSVLFGRTEREWLFDTYGGTPPYVIAKSSDRATMYTLGGKLGVTWFASPGTSLTIGYQAEQVWRLRQAYSDLDAGDVGTIDGRGNNLVHGPFAKLGIYFDPVARPSAPTPTRWTGFRFGVDAGGGSVVAEAQNATLSMPPAAPQTFNGAGNLNGGLAGFHGGFDLQFGPLLAGLEGDVAWTNITGTGKISTVDSVTFGIDRLASLRGRAGVVYESALLYVTGGAAWSSVNSTLQAAGATASGRNDHEGWVAGAGLEYRLAPQWSARAEYLHYDLGTRSYALEAGGATYSADTNLKADVLRVGVSWIFAALP